jgi:hypothetical protein
MTMMNVLKAVLTVNLTVVMANVFMVHGHVMDMLTVLVVQMKLIVV